MQLQGSVWILNVPQRPTVLLRGGGLSTKGQVGASSLLGGMPLNRTVGPWSSPSHPLPFYRANSPPPLHTPAMMYCAATGQSNEAKQL
jgi:hypothetical protein